MTLPIVALLQTTGAATQEREGDPSQSGDQRLVIDLTLPPPDSEPDPLLEQRCEEEADAARIVDEIVVCRSLGEVTDGAWDAADFERRYAEVTQGIKTPNVDGTGISLPTEGSVITITVTMKMGDAPEQPLIIDVEALPEAPPGSDADRIARGLAPLDE